MSSSRSYRVTFENFYIYIYICLCAVNKRTTITRTPKNLHIHLYRYLLYRLHIQYTTHIIHILSYISCCIDIFYASNIFL